MPVPDDSTWIELTDNTAVQALMEAFGGFHDACIREIHVATGHFVAPDLSMNVDWRTTVHMTVQRQFLNPSAIELRFEEIVGLKFAAPEPNCDSMIFDATCVIRDGLLYWADSGLWNLASPEAHDCTWVAARRAYWRDLSGWLGSELRYRSSR
jgi:hypothetical protein